MKYQLVLDDVFEWDGNDYIVLDIYEYKESKYYFTNKILNEDEPGKEYVVFKGLEDGLVIEDDKTILDAVLPIFSTNANKRIEYLETYIEEGEE